MSSFLLRTLGPLGLSALFLVPAGHATTLPECRKWIDSAPYRSKEGLLQMFLQAAKVHHVQKAVLTHSTLLELREQIETLFPLEDAEQVTYADSVLEIQFMKPVSVSVPGSWLQTELTMSRLVRFRVHPLQERNGFEFEVMAGQIDLESGFLARLVSGMPELIRGRKLRYWSDDQARVSAIELEQETRLPPASLGQERQEGSLRLVGPFPAPFVFTDSTAESGEGRYLARRDSVRSPDGKWTVSPSRAREIRGYRTSFATSLGNASTRTGMVSRDIVEYRLEERKASRQRAFSLAR